MTLLEKAAQLALVAQAVLIFISLVFIWFQLRQNAQIAKAANAQSLVGQALAFTAMLVQCPELARLWHDQPKFLQDDSNEDRYREMLVQWLIFHENIYYQHRKGLLDDAIYRSWSQDLRYTLQRHDLRVITDDIEDFFPGAYGKHLLSLRKKLLHSETRSVTTV